MADQFHFFAMMSRMKHINRWGLMRNTQNENIQEHSLMVAMIAHGLALIGNKYLGKQYDEERVCVLAVYHDASEIITGDMPTPVKYHNPEIRNAYKKVEQIASNRLLAILPAALRAEYDSILIPQDTEVEYWRLVKAADKIAAYIKCVEELKAGNLEFKKASEATKKNIDHLNCPEANWFMEHFIDSFSLTLDEQY